MKNIIILLIIFFSLSTYGQISQGGKPKSFNKEIKEKIKTALKSAKLGDEGYRFIQGISKEEEKAKAKKLNKNCSDCKSKYYGKEIDFDCNFFEEALLVHSENGDKIWQLQIESADAEGYQLLFNKFDLPRGCELYIYNLEKSMVLGSFNEKNNRTDKQFVTQNINGNSIFIELFISKASKRKPKLSMKKIVFIFDDVLKKGPYSKDGAGDCHMNVACDTNYDRKKLIKSVALILEQMDGKYWGFCTGTLINKENNYGDSDHPYFLTANHCYESVDGENKGTLSNTSNWVFLFHHESRICDSDGSEISRDLTKSITGAEVIARDAESKGTDFLLLQLHNTFGEFRHYDVAFAGWSRIPFYPGSSDGTTTCIHHPAGDIKKIAYGTETPTSDKWLGETIEDTHWKVYWSEGNTEKGSSGSPLLNSNNEIVGILSAGRSNCEYVYVDGELHESPELPDLYGKFDKSCLNDVTLSNSLSPSGMITMDTYEPLSSYELSISVETDPYPVYREDEFSIKASVNGQAPIRWNLIVCKAYWSPDVTAYPEYNYTHSTITSDNNFESVTFDDFDFVGSYMAEITAIDSKGRSCTKTFTIDMRSFDHDCVDVKFLEDECSKQTVFSKGSFFNLKDFVTVINWDAYESGPCHENMYTASQSYYAKYQGVSRILWSKPYSNFEHYDFYTSPNYPDGGEYYRPGYHGICTQLNEEGTFTFELTAQLGTLYYDGYNFSPTLMRQLYPFAEESIVKRIIVVDCDKVERFNTKSELEEIGEIIDGSNITLDPSSQIEINEADVFNIRSYVSATLRPGVHIKKGASFLATAIKCPESKCDCNENKSIVMEESIETKKTNIEYINDKIKLYPNPASTYLNLMVPIEMSEINEIQIINALGQVVGNYDVIVGNNVIDVGHLTVGVYIVPSINKKVIIEK